MPGRRARAATRWNSSRVQPVCWVTGPAVGLGGQAQVDQPGVVVDDQRRDVGRHALQRRVGAEGLERGAGVAVAEVDPAVGEQVVDAVHRLVGDQARQVVAVDLEEVGRVALGGRRAHGRQRLVVGAVGLHLHPGGGVLGRRSRPRSSCTPPPPGPRRRRRTERSVGPVGVGLGVADGVPSPERAPRDDHSQGQQRSGDPHRTPGHARHDIDPRHTGVGGPRTRSVFP